MPPTDRIALETAACAGHERGRQTYWPKRLQAELAETGFKLSEARQHSKIDNQSPAEFEKIGMTSN